MIVPIKNAKKDSMIGVRLPSEQRLRAEQIIREGRFKNLSEVVRVALQEFLASHSKPETSP
jgi:Arc/MetJ-type ribon-helix-helix transcriptional regulator